MKKKSEVNVMVYVVVEHENKKVQSIHQEVKIFEVTFSSRFKMKFKENRSAWHREHGNNFMMICLHDLYQKNI
jgi:hypothetical protein